MSMLFPTQGALFPSSFTSAAAACAFVASCPGFEPWATELIAEEAGNFASSAPALVLQGSADNVVLPAQTSCIVQRLMARGTPVQGCSYAGLDHGSIVPGALPDAIGWMAARRAGQSPNACVAPIVDACTLPN
jgi:acetyl esterase/lipase